MSEADAAARLGWTVSDLWLFEHGQRRVTDEDAAQLERVTGIHAVFWLKLQARLDLWIARYRQRTDTH